MAGVSTYGNIAIKNVNAENINLAQSTNSILNTGDMWYDTTIKYQIGTTTVARESSLQVLNTQGDLLTYNSSTYAKLPIGTNTYVLTTDSSTTTGLAWKTIVPSLLNLKNLYLLALTVGDQLGYRFIIFVFQVNGLRRLISAASSLRSLSTTMTNVDSFVYVPEAPLFNFVVNAGGVFYRSSTGASYSTYGATSNIAFTTTNTRPVSSHNSLVYVHYWQKYYCTTVQTSGNKLISSDIDATTWTEVSGTNLTTVGPISSIAYNPTNGVIVVKGLSGDATDNAYYSIDGITFTTVNTRNPIVAFPSGIIGNVIYANSIFVATGGAVSTSTDGSNWTQRDSAIVYTCVDYSPNLNSFLAVSTQSSTWATSSNGTSWTLLSGGPFASVSSVKWCDPNWIMVNASNPMQFAYSNTGLTASWVTATVLTSNILAIGGLYGFAN
jgi:hypothetical protein